ncbi:hypothetical protein ACEPPN_009142 [Leptodophora sp. 'Broadleaf-Isolate-01']
MCQKGGLGGDCFINKSNDLRFKKGLRKAISDMGIEIAALEQDKANLHRSVDQQAYTITQLRNQIADNRAQRSRSNNQCRFIDGNTALESFEPMVVKASDGDLTKLIDLINAEIGKRKFPNKTDNELGGASRTPGIHSTGSSSMHLAASGVIDQPAMDTRNEQDMHLFNAPSQLVVPYSNSMAHVLMSNNNYNGRNGANSSIQQNSSGYQIPPNAVSAHQSNIINQQHGDFARSSNDNQPALELQTTASYSQTQNSMHQSNNPAQAYFSGLQNGYSMQTQALTGQSYANQQGNAVDQASFGGLQHGCNVQTQALTAQSCGEPQGNSLGNALDQAFFGAVQEGFNMQTQDQIGQQYATQQENTAAQEYPGLSQNGFDTQTRNLAAQQNTFQTPNAGHGLNQSYNYAQSGMSQQENSLQQMGRAQLYQQTFGHQQNYNPQNMNSYWPADDDNSNASHEEQYMSVADAQALVNFINFGQS